MKFGYKEIKEFAENHEDERVQIMYRKLCETRSRTAKWCDAAVAAETRVKELEQELHKAGDGDTWREACGRLEAEIVRLIEENKILRSGWRRQSEKHHGWGKYEWWNEPIKTPVKWNTTTTGHTNCEKCNGTGTIPFQTVEPGTMKFDTAWIKCDWCNLG
jgi:hypothetical protein